MEKRELLPPSDDTASRALIDVQTATTRVKTIISECVSKGIPDDELTKRLNEAIAVECKRIKDAPFREQFRKALITSARKWHYQLTQTYRINEQNFANAVKQQPLNIELKNLLGKTPFQKQFDFRRILDDGTNPGIPVIRDYQKGLKLSVRAISAEPPKIVTPKNGKAYVMSARLRAEMAVRYSASVDSLQRLIDDGVNWCWISSHPNCSERCKEFQGKLYSLFKEPKEIDGKTYNPSGTVDGIPYEYIGKALAGPKDDGNGCISGYNCRHRAIAYERGSRPPADYTDAEIKKAYAIDKQQRSYENRIRHLKQEEAQLRACGMTEEAKALRKKWRVLTRDYQIYSIQNDRAYYPYRYIVDRTEVEQRETAINDNISEENVAETVDNPVHWSIINKKGYFDSFKSFVGEKRVVFQTLVSVVRKTLKHRDHSDKEDLYLIDARNGREVEKNTKATERLKVLPTERMKQLLEADDDKKYILFHNHPLSSPPSVADLNALYKNPKIKFGIIVGHNGKMYKYTAPKNEIPKEDLEIAIKHYRNLNYSQATSEEMAYKDLEKKFGFTLEVLDYGKEN